MASSQSTEIKKKGKSGGEAAGKNYYTARGRSIAGAKGIYVTCVRGKEMRCVGEMYELLDEVADRVYLPERIAELNKLRAHRYEGQDSVEGASQPEQDQPNDGGLEDNSDDDGEDESIEASIARELAELKEDHAQKQSKGKGKGKARDPKDKSKPKGSKPRFVSVQTNTECVCFFATSWPYDPVELTQAIIEETQRTGVSRTRYAQRLSPIIASCHAFNIEQVERDSRSYIEKAITEYASRTGKTNLTYYIDTSIRCHTEPITRDWLLATLGSIVRSLATEPNVETGRCALNVSVSSTDADLILLPTVLRNSYGLGVVEGRLWNGKSGRRFNIEQIAAEARRRIEQEEQHVEAKSEQAVEAKEDQELGQQSMSK